MASHIRYDPPKHLKRWTLPSHYLGASWSEYYSAGVGQSRDNRSQRSDLCAIDLKSNFQIL
jgi:hypothetical protein